MGAAEHIEHPPLRVARLDSVTGYYLGALISPHSRPEEIHKFGPPSMLAKVNFHSLNP